MIRTLKAQKSSTTSKVLIIIFVLLFAAFGIYTLRGSNAVGPVSQQVATAVQASLNRLNATRRVDSSVYNWPGIDCARCNAAIGLAAAAAARVNNDPQTLAEAKQILDGAVALEPQPGVLPDAVYGAVGGEGTMFFANELGPALMLLHSQLSPSEISSWTKSITSGAQWMVAEDLLNYYINGNIIAGQLGTEALAYQLTKNPIYQQYYTEMYNFAVNPPQSGQWAGFGFITTKQPTKSDGSDGAGYFTESGAGTNGWVPKGSGLAKQYGALILNGKHSLQVTTNSASGDGTQNLYKLTPNTTYTLSLDAQSATGDINDLSVGYEQNGIDTNCLSNQQITTNWKLLSCSFTTGPTLNRTDRFYVKKTGTAAETWYINQAQIQPNGGTIATFNPGDPGFDPDYTTLQLDQLTRVWLINHDPNILKLMNMEMNALLDLGNTVSSGTNAPECGNSLYLFDSGGGSRHGSYPRCELLDTSALGVLAANGRSDLQPDLAGQIDIIANEFGQNQWNDDRNYHAVGMIPASLIINDLGLSLPLPATPESTDTTPPSQPQGVSSNVSGPNSITINWQPSTDNVGVTKYYIRQNGQVIATVPAGTSIPTTFTDTTPTKNTPYSYTVTAGDDAGNVSARSTGTPNLMTIGAPPTMTFSANPDTVSPNGSSTLIWSSTYAASCKGSGAWNIAQPANSPAGGYITAPLSTTTTYTLTCTGGGGSVSASVNVAVGSTTSTPPTVSIDSGPANPTSSTSANFTFSGVSSATPSTLTYQCQLDSGSYISCNSPQAYSGLSVGTHTFSIKATDSAGTSSTVVSKSWIITANTPIVGDLNGDGHVNIFDLSIFLNHWQQSGTNLPEDFNHDSIVNIFDLSTLLSHYGA